MQRFTASSGNFCDRDFFQKGTHVVIDANWDVEPSVQDVAECDLAISQGWGRTVPSVMAASTEEAEQIAKRWLNTESN